jgi:hypothetical protein
MTLFQLSPTQFACCEGNAFLLFQFDHEKPKIVKVHSHNALISLIEKSETGSIFVALSNGTIQRLSNKQKQYDVKISPQSYPPIFMKSDCDTLTLVYQQGNLVTKSSYSLDLSELISTHVLFESTKLDGALSIGNYLVCFHQKGFVIVDSKNGKQKFIYVTPGIIYGASAVSDSRFAIIEKLESPQRDEIRIVDLTTWSFDKSITLMSSDLVFMAMQQQSTLLVLTKNGYIHAIDTNSGETQFSTQLFQSFNNFIQLFALEDNKFVIVDPTNQRNFFVFQALSIGYTPIKGVGIDWDLALLQQSSNSKEGEWQKGGYCDENGSDYLFSNYVFAGTVYKYQYPDFTLVSRGGDFNVRFNPKNKTEIPRNISKVSIKEGWALLNKDTQFIGKAIFFENDPERNYQYLHDKIAAYLIRHLSKTPEMLSLSDAQKNEQITIACEFLSIIVEHASEYNAKKIISLLSNLNYSQVLQISDASKNKILNRFHRFHKISLTNKTVAFVITLLCLLSKNKQYCLNLDQIADYITLPQVTHYLFDPENKKTVQPLVLVNLENFIKNSCRKNPHKKLEMILARIDQTRANFNVQKWREALI